MKTSFADFITEGGTFGHLNNIWEIGDLTVSNLISIIDQSVKLKFEFPELKLDSVALAFTVRDDGKVVASRNKGQTKNFGYAGLDANGINARFKGHQLEFAYTWAVRNLQDAINHLSDSQKKKIFNDGRNWMMVEVLGWGASNIIDYGGVKELTLLGTVEHDVDGNKVGPINKQNARILDGMLRQRSAEQQSKFVIRNVDRATFNEIQNADRLKSVLSGKVRKIMKGAKTIDEYKSKELLKIIGKRTNDRKLLDMLVNRWIHMNKSPNIRDITKQYPNDEAWIKDIEANIGSIMKQIVLPLEKVFLKLGAEVLSALSVFKSSDPAKTAAKLRKDFMNAVDRISASNDDKLIQKMTLELQRLQAAGGAGAIAPEEGITFFVNFGSERRFVKLTGAFAPVNQIIGLLYNITER